MGLTISPKAGRSIKRLPKEVQLRIVRAINSLEEDPFPSGYQKLTNRPGYRIRVGTYRVIYLFDEKKKGIFIINVGHRREIYLL